MLALPKGLLSLEALASLIAGASGCLQASSSRSRSSGHELAWPPGKTAGVSLTYDDALRSQLEVAVPALTRHHLVGTFYLTQGARSTPDEWSALLARGHELASHTMQHPCDAAFSWVPEGGALQDYDVARMTAELHDSIGLLTSLG